MPYRLDDAATQRDGMRFTGMSPGTQSPEFGIS